MPSSAGPGQPARGPAPADGRSQVPGILACAAALCLAPAAMFIARNLDLYPLRVLAPVLVASAAVAAMVLLLALAASLVVDRRWAACGALAVAAFWFLQFKHAELGDLLHGPGVALAVMVATALLLARLAPLQPVRRALLLFLAGSLLLVGGTEYAELQQRRGVDDATLQPPPAVPFTPGEPRRVNVYYVILDGLGSARLLRERIGLDVEPQLKRLREQGFEVLQDARSAYNVTHLTLASIFYQAYPVDEHSPRYQNRDLFFPSMLVLDEKLSLFATLDKLGYRLTHIGNALMPCTRGAQVRCLTDHGAAMSPWSEMVNAYAVQVFLQGSWLARHLGGLPQDAAVPRSINDNDALQTAMHFLQQRPAATRSRGQFFFIHHMNPHPPARDEQCRVRRDRDYAQEDLSGYRSSVVCAFRRMEEFAATVARTDPDAIVVFQGDHGPHLAYDFGAPVERQSAAALEERFSIFNAVKLPPDCRGALASDFGNVETINAVVGCLGRAEMPRPAPRSYAASYEQGPGFGTVQRVFGARTSSEALSQVR